MSLKQSTDLQKLLREFSDGRNREANFRRIADHLSGLIYHSAFRQSGDSSVAEDVTQNVLLQISRKAGKLSKHPKLLAWVHEATRLEVLQMRRSKARRIKREEKAMKDIEKEQTSCPHLLSDLDESLRSLSSLDRELVLMRFFEGWSFPAIAARTGRSETAEKKRLNRVLEKLSRWFGRKGTVLSVAGLTTILSAEMAKAAPVGLSVAMTEVGVVAVGTGSAKMAGGAALLLTAGFGFQVMSSWSEVRDLQAEKEKLIHSGATLEQNWRTRIVDREGNRDRFGQVRLEPSLEEVNLPVSELAWRYGRADDLSDKVTLDRIELVLEMMDLEELEEFCLALPDSRSSEVIHYIQQRLSPKESLDFLMRARVGDSSVGYVLQFSLPLQQAGEWLFEKEESGSLKSVSVRRDYRHELWRHFHRKLRSAAVLSGKAPDTEHFALVEKCLVLSPAKTRPSFAKLEMEMKASVGIEKGEEK